MTRVLVINAGSSTLKVSVVDARAPEPVAAATIEWGADATRATARRAGLEQALATLPSDVAAAAHRVVHGGTRFRAPVLVDDDVLAALAELSSLAPLHNPVAVEALRIQRELRPDLPCIAAFDTAFHSTIEEASYVYALPYSWHEDWGVRRYGFHGLSVEWSVGRASEMLDVPVDRLSLLVAHLGSGCSVTAVRDGHSVWTSMGFTPLEGMAMGTRSGSVDPGILLYAMREHGLSPADLDRVLDHESGLLGITGKTADWRVLTKAWHTGDERAGLAHQIFIRRAAEEIAAAATHAAHFQALVFTGGIGENDPSLRSAIVDRLQVIGLPGGIPQDTPNEDGVLVGGEHGSPAVLRVTAREDIVMAKAALALAPGR